ncbi:sensor domain-containing diguanylate cyclase [Sphingomonas spermidinifaciens]|uniref:diguanylate cyclase n=1 Tax=Sphingomonas spermidinifaciens TaxID=1141889 RepID=A0A2A4B3Z3_9SPHN|nr:diguanylate cyclase [Sphingomonas spermidinifaciens]PCD02499.1 sensor domain-containing diguanylate cyclase [Sphingomonas spermidinifaciens]
MARSDVRSLTGSKALLVFGAVYAAAIGFSLLTRFGGGVACMWLATGVLAPLLAKLPPRLWWRVGVAAMSVSGILTATAGLGPIAALPLAPLNFAEAAIVALALRRFAPVNDGALRSIGQVAVVIGGGVLAAGVSGLPAAFVAAQVTPTDVWSNWFNWTTGHSLGTIALAPIGLLLLSGDLGRWWAEAAAKERLEAAILAAVVTLVAMVTFTQSSRPLLFLPLLPVVLTTFRLGRVGAAVSTLILSAIAILFTLRGAGPIALMPPDPAMRVHFVQFYLATVVLTVLPAAADLRRRKDVLRRLEASEARYRLVTENASDVVLTLDPDGLIRFVSPSIEGLGDYRVAALVGTPAVHLLAPEYRAAAARAHLDALRHPGTSQVVEVETRPDAEGVQRWIEMRMRAIESGAAHDPLELVCAIRDVSKRKSVEAELQRAARTDPLTGLANRRLFNDALDLVLDRVRRDNQAMACIAIFDIDHFKRVNDAFGHDAGDRVLARFAEVAARVTRAKDLVARLGGEEFGLVLPGAGREEAHAICDRLRTEFAGAAMVLDDGSYVWSTVSAGIAALGPDDTRADAMRVADAALYAAKRAGRDRLVLAA